MACLADDVGSWGQSGQLVPLEKLPLAGFRVDFELDLAAKLTLGVSTNFVFANFFGLSLVRKCFGYPGKLKLCPWHTNQTIKPWSFFAIGDAFLDQRCSAADAHPLGATFRAI